MIKKLKHITVICRELYEEKGASAVYDYIREKKPTTVYDTICIPCEAVTPHWSGECLICGTHSTLINIHDGTLN
jgi:hypothetical protein